MFNMENYINLIIAALLSAGPPIFVKMYVNSKNKNLLYLIASLICSILLIILYIKLVKNHNIALIYTIIKILSILVVVIISYFLLKEKITIKNIFGILLSIVALCLLYN
jgi:multidrug transporter EmrE-like cation transporter